MKNHFHFDLNNKSEAVITRDRIVTTIPNTGTHKTPTGEKYSVQVVTSLPYGGAVLRYAVTLGVAGANNYYHYAWGPQGHDAPAYVELPIGTDKENTVEGDILETAQARHAALFQGQENTTALLNAIETLVKRAKAQTGRKRS